MNQIAYKFVSWDVPALESLAGSKAYILRKRLNDGGTLTREEKDWITREVNHNTYFKDSIPLLGYRFNFVDVLKTVEFVSSEVKIPVCNAVKLGEHTFIAELMRG